MTGNQSWAQGREICKWSPQLEEPCGAGIQASVMEKPPPREAIWKHSEKSADKASLVSSLSGFLLCSSVNLRLFFSLWPKQEINLQTKVNQLCVLEQITYYSGLQLLWEMKFLGAAVTSYHKPSGLKQWKFILSRCWKSVVWNRGVSEIALPLTLLGGDPFLPPPASGGCTRALARLGLWAPRSDPCLHRHVPFSLCVCSVHHIFLWRLQPLDFHQPLSFSRMTLF